MIYGNIRTRCGSGTILHLDVAQWGGQPNHELPTLESVRAFLGEHPEVQAGGGGMSRKKTPREVRAVTECCPREVRLCFQGPTPPAVGTVVSGFDTNLGRMRHFRVVRPHKDWNLIGVVEELEGAAP